MTHFVAISNLNASAEYELFSADTLDAAMEAAAASMGGHPAIEAGVVRSRSGFGGEFVREGSENGRFWSQVMTDIFEGKDNQEWFHSQEPGAAEAQAVAYHRGEELLDVQG